LSFINLQLIYERAKNQIMYDPQKSMPEYECEIIEKALLHYKGNKSAVAKSLGLSRLTVYKKIEEYGIEE